jgi:hypothetical protein
MTKPDPLAKGLRSHEFGRSSDHRWAEITGLTSARCSALDGQCHESRAMRPDRTVGEYCWFHQKVEDGWDADPQPVKTKKRKVRTS